MGTAVEPARASREAAVESSLGWRRVFEPRTPGMAREGDEHAKRALGIRHMRRGESERVAAGWAHIGEPVPASAGGEQTKSCVCALG